MTRFIQKKIGLLFIPACVLVAPSAFAQSGDCREDTDCAEGQFCEKPMYVDGCAVSPDEPATECNSEPQVAEVGYCVTPPTPCEADEECDEYLSCVEESSGGDCAIDSEGNTFCSEPDTAPVKYCGIAATTCETDEDCPREFECASVSLCLAVDCIEGDTECNSACTESGQKECQPKQIPCEETTDCPSAWSCLGNVIQNCSGGGEDSSGSGEGSSGSDKGTSEGTSGSGEGTSEEYVAPDEVTCTEEPAVGTCYPDAYGGGPVYANDDILEAGGEDGVGSTNDVTSGESESASAGGGCSVARGPGRPDVTWALGLLLALPLIRRRRAHA